MATVAVKERPILFSGEMVRAILDGRKTQTRRIVKPQPELSETGGFVHVDRKGKRWATGLGSDFAGTCRNFVASVSPFKVGQRLWVRETWQCEDCEGVTPRNIEPSTPVAYSATATPEDRRDISWQPSIFMPRWASRITLEITEVRVQRLQEISRDDSFREGVEHVNPYETHPELPNGMPACFRNYQDGGWFAADPIASFRSLWKSINGPDSWNANPWVWAITFRKI